MVKKVKEKKVANVSEGTREIVRRILENDPVKYDSEYHCNVLIEIMGTGSSIVAFTSFVGVSKKTFFEWVDKYPEFEEAYSHARAISEVWWENQGKLGVQDTSFNTSCWNINMRNRFGYTDHRKLRIAKLKKAATPTEQIKVVFEELSQGNLTGPESMQVSHLILAGVKAEESTEMKNDIKELKELAGKR